MAYHDFTAEAACLTNKPKPDLMKSGCPSWLGWLGGTNRNRKLGMSHSRSMEGLKDRCCTTSTRKLERDEGASKAAEA
ncbi:hypothetical protein SADUNF_Sadunf16G0283300 [Salix dunnii]|uniref:Uncharacterized protein n=1 Tax=Salix dunnii TaxID=1413687 RepID=A0A835MKA2_9ROSI|nr:hypothetical protein SADUNF_Sadunf16G0283300 [Salix dunnii]